MAKTNIPGELHAITEEGIGLDSSELGVYDGNKVDNAPTRVKGDVAIVGSLADTIPVNNDDDGAMPANGGNYYIGSIGGLGFSNEMAAMTLGCTIVFTATQDFAVSIPHVIVDDGVATSSPTHTAYMAGATALECESGSSYILTITAANLGTGVGNVRQYANIFSLAELIEPDEEDVTIVVEP